MDSLCIVPCGKRKIWDTDPARGPVPASQAYTGNFASTAREYARTFYPDSWIVLSAKYGFLWPTDLVEGPYNVSFSRRHDHVIHDAKLREQVAILGLGRFTEIVVIAATAYTAAVRRAFGDRTARIRSPLIGLPNMGSMISAMKESIAAGALL